MNYSVTDITLKADFQAPNGDSLSMVNNTDKIYIITDKIYTIPLWHEFFLIFKCPDNTVYYCFDFTLKESSVHSMKFYLNIKMCIHKMGITNSMTNFLMVVILYWILIVAKQKHVYLLMLISSPILESVF
jgi:hypothetical protein